MDYSDYFESQPNILTRRNQVPLWLNSRPFLFLLVVLSLVGWGLITLYSASYDEALRLDLSPSYFFIRQTFFALLGFAAFWVLSILPLSFIRHAAYPLLVLSFILMLMTLFTPFGVEKMGARRWLDLPVIPSFQPSELIKIAIIITGARLFSAKGDSKVGKKELFVFLLLILLTSALMVAQKDYSTTVVFIATVGTLMLLAGVALLPLLISAFILAVPMMIFLLIEPYRIRRVVSFLFPTMDPSGINYQVNRAMQAIQSGGLFGKGLGNGNYKLGLIPEVHSDFILASFAEESGALGIFILFALFLALFLVGMTSAYSLMTQHAFISYLASGFSLMILLQAMVNIAVVTRLLPPTGIPLPFFSQGGTNLFVVIAECGLLYRCIREASR